MRRKMKYLSISLWLYFLELLCYSDVQAAFGPPYPITGAWFKERYTQHEWNATLHQFSKQGGDSVIIRAPTVNIRTKDEIMTDPDFQWCYVTNSSGPEISCVDEAETQLKDQGVTVRYWATYAQERAWDQNALIQCPNYEKKIVVGRIYHRIVIPVNNSEVRDKCIFKGLDVVVIFTQFSGIDSNDLLFPLAQEYNMSVFLGVPSLSRTILNNKALQTTFLDLMKRIILSHEERSKEFIMSTDNLKSNSSITGYFWSEEFLLNDIWNEQSEALLFLLREIAAIVREYGKLFCVSTSYSTNKLLNDKQVNLSEALEVLAREGHVDVVSVFDGRGTGNSGLFWQTQLTSPIQTVDLGLYNVLKSRHPNLHTNITFDELFTASTAEVFEDLANTTDILRKVNPNLKLWLGIESFDLLYDDPCLPIDHSASGLSRMLNGISKSRLDHVLTHAGAAVQKVVAMAWDPSFTCSTRKHTYPLTNQVVEYSSQPIISHCSFHSSSNRSVVVIGYGMDGETQSFTLNWPRVDGQMVQSTVYGYYFELDWGIENKRVPSLMYIQMYDPPDILNLAPKGHVKITAHGSDYACVFKYDFTSTDQSKQPKHDNRKLRKKFVRERKIQSGFRRLEAQDFPFKH